MATYQKPPPRPRDQRNLRLKLEAFADGIARNPARYNLSDEQSAEISRAIQAFSKAQAIASSEDTKTKCTVMDKDKKREIAEKIHSRYYNLVKNDPAVPDGDVDAPRDIHGDLQPNERFLVPLDSSARGCRTPHHSGPASARGPQAGDRRRGGR